MRWKRAATLCAAMRAPATAGAAPELSVGDRLEDRREVTAGTRAYSVGFQDGRFYANGWHITGEMGGVWTPPLKLADGVWFGVDDQWVGPATKFTQRLGLHALRPAGDRGLEAAPDRLRAGRTPRRAVRPELTNPGRPRDRDGQGRRALGVDRRVPVGLQRRRAQRERQPRRHRRLRRAARWSSRPGHAARRRPHDYAALVGSDRSPAGGETGAGLLGRAAGHRCAGPRPGRCRSACDDGPFGNGTGGQLRYRVDRQGQRRRDRLDRGRRLRPGPAPRRAASSPRRCATPAARWRRRSRPVRELAEALAGSTLPGDRRCRTAVDWGKQNIADLTQTATTCRSATSTRASSTRRPSGTVRERRWSAPATPTTRGCSPPTASTRRSRGVAVGQFEAIKDAPARAARHLRDRSTTAPARSCTRSSPTARSGSAPTSRPGQHRRDGQVPERRRAALALDRRRPLPRRRCTTSRSATCTTSPTHLDADGDGWPEGLGNVERGGHGPGEARQHRLLRPRSVRPRRHGAGQGRRGDERWATRARRRLRARFDATGGCTDRPVRRLAGRRQRAVQQKHWIGGTPMEAELTVDGARRPRPGPVRPRLARSPSARRLLQRRAPVQPRPVPHGLRRRPERRRRADDLLAQHRDPVRRRGQLRPPGAEQQKRYTDANAETMFAEPATAARPTSSRARCRRSCRRRTSGAEHRSLLDLPLDVHAGLGQLRHRVAGRAPAARRPAGPGPRRAEVVPQLPPAAAHRRPRIRLGNGALDVRAERSGRRFVTTIDTDDLRLHDLRVGATLPRGTKVGSVTLDGRRVKRPIVRETNRGVEVTVRTGGGRHTVVVG